jgi:hypothetical protein
MNTVQLREELFRAMNPLLDSEVALEKLIKYVKNLTAQKQGPTLLSKEEFYAKLERGEEEYKQGKCHTMLSGETLDDF